jgi:hypothetical protein
MKSIETHTYETPLNDNRDCPFSVGIMNLTREEARAIAGYVSQLIMSRGGSLSQYTTDQKQASAWRPNGTPADYEKELQLRSAFDPPRVVDGPRGGEVCAECKQPINNGRMLLIENARGRFAYHLGCEVKRKSSKPGPEPDKRNRFSELDFS